MHLNIVHLETWLNEVQSSNPGAIRQAFGFVFWRAPQLEVMQLNAIHIRLCRKNYTSPESITRSPKQRHLTQSDEELLWFSLAWVRLLCFRASQQVATRMLPYWSLQPCVGWTEPGWPEPSEQLEPLDQASLATRNLIYWFLSVCLTHILCAIMWKSMRSNQSDSPTLPLSCWVSTPCCLGTDGQSNQSLL